MSFGERGQIFALVINHPIFPATENNANPFEGQPSHRRVVPLAPLPLLLIVAARPLRVGNGMTGPLVKALPQNFGQAQRKWIHFFFPLRSVTGAIPL